MTAFDREGTDGVSAGLAELRAAVTTAPPADIAAEHLDAIFAAQDVAGVARVRANRSTVAMIAGSAAAAILVVSAIGLRIPADPTTIETAAPAVETIEGNLRDAVASRVAGNAPAKPTGDGPEPLGGTAESEVTDPQGAPSQAGVIADDGQLVGEGEAPSSLDPMNPGPPHGDAPPGHVPDHAGMPTHANGGTRSPAGEEAREAEPESAVEEDPALDQDPASELDEPPLVTVLHGEPIELALCDGLEPTIVGSNGPDIIVGTDGPDVIAAGNGADIIHALGGDDVVCGGNGADEIDGGEGDDRLFGGNGPDLIVGDAGVDEVDHGLGGPADSEEISNRP